MLIVQTDGDVEIPADVLGETLRFMSVAFPDIQPKNLQTQMGVHFEEVGEMIATLEGQNGIAQTYLDNALGAIQQLADYMKNTVEPMVVVGEANRTEFLDAVCDQLVTAAGSGYVHGMDVLGGLAEVNRSNFSKFGTNGEPIHHPQTQKLIKGPNYSPAELARFV